MTRLSTVLHRLKKDDRGNVTIEMAFVFSILAFLALGTFDFGRLLFERIRLEQLARTGVQIGLRSQSDAINIPTIEAAVLTAAEPDNDGMAVTAVNTCECPESTGSVSCLTTCIDDNYPQLFLTVTVDRDYAMLFGVPGFVENWALSANASIRVR